MSHANEAGPPAYLPPYAPASGSGSRQPVEEELPTYDGRSASRFFTFTPTSGINDKLAPTYRIGDNHTPPLVLPSDLEAHLLLLGAFWRLRESVRTQKGGLEEGKQLDPEQLWAVFLERAVYRFELWVTQMMDVIAQEEESEGEAIASHSRVDGRMEEDRVPPSDVVMIWHTYMLSPRDYYEDCLRMHKGLLNIRSFPLFQLAALVDPETHLPRPVEQERKATWKAFTGEEFDPPLRTTMKDLVPVFCPRCSTRNLVQWLTSTGHGYAQRTFGVSCHQCELAFGREALCARKFYEDMERCIFDPLKHVLRMTLVDNASGMPDPELARKYTAILLNFQLNPIPQTPEQLGRKHGWWMHGVEKILRAGFMTKMDKVYLETPRPVNVVMSAYRHTGPFSLDLASAVMRQMSFVEKMVNFGWTESGRFEDDKDTLARCVNRYHAFLDLMASTPGKFVVPTLDIDLAWHTHQLLCTSYRKLYALIGMIPHHDDKVTEVALAEAYDETAELWKAKFGVPYSVCGCLPPSATKASAQATASTLFSLKGKGRANANSTQSLPKNPRPDLITASDDLSPDGQETHPSEHNAIAIINPPLPTIATPQINLDVQSAAQAQVRRSKMEKRSKEVGKLAERGRVDGWAELMNGRREKTGLTHAHTFLCAVPFGEKDALGAYGHGNCAVFSGRGLAGPLSAGQCAKGNGYTGLCGALVSQRRGGVQQAINTAIVMTGERTMRRDYGRARAAGMDFLY